MKSSEVREQYICINCGYLYDPSQGDGMNSIPPGISFEELPRAWVCPLCYASRDDFDPLD
ncbi:rubredoxin [Desulfogranum mediterraneum]|uniref:rubredoxin n=1 Tax=Desulfogranum mediterraneum TaxID=160661 RepID=UPI0005572B8E|nr:rubredoxin [Desulfogranum mediterraneum]